jgi:hypothetical protein
VTRRAALVVALAASLLVLPGCGWLLGSGVGGAAEASGGSDEEAAAGNVRAAVPAIEAYYADHGSYEGATVEILRTYDYGIGEIQVAPGADTVTYCISSTVGSATVSKHGPTGDIQRGGC